MFLNNIYIIKYYLRKQSLAEARKQFGTWLQDAMCDAGYKI